MEKHENQQIVDFDLGVSLILLSMTEPQQKLLSIGEFSSASRLSTKALRIYDERGILPPAYIDPDSGYRYYSTAQFAQARLVRLLRQMEMPLAKIKAILESDPEEVDQHIRKYAVDYSARISRVQQTIRLVLGDVNKESKVMPFQSERVEIGAQQIVSIMRHTYVQRLDKTIRKELEELREFVAKQRGEISGAPLGIYHGSITEESNGPIEICLPANGTFTPTGDIVVRELSGGASVRVIARGSQCVFPAILGAYDAAVDWIQGNGFEMIEPPREVWASKVGEELEMHIVWLYQ